jgi:hypothetical protein
MNLASTIISTDVTIRPIPYPYQAMLAICSDLDETPDKNVYYETIRFLNTNEETVMGRGAGLEVGNTIYFDMPPGQFSYWNTDDMGREMVRNLICSGHIDCLHSYGDLATTRKHAGRALDELDRHNCNLKVWVDHGTAPTNFDGDIMKGSGDVPGSPAYHADLTIGSGLEYVWRGRVTSVIGQNIPRSLSGIGTLLHPIRSGKTLLKEFTKGQMALYGHKKYRMHAKNNILRHVNLRDGKPVWEFMRCNPHWGGVSSCETAFGIADVLTKPILQRLVDRKGACILYTHLGKIGKNANIFTPRTCQAFQNLASFMRDGKILVTTTRRLLEYCRMKEGVTASVTSTENVSQINVSCSQDLKTLEGLTLYVTDSKEVRLFVNKIETSGFQRNPPDETSRPSITLPWNKLAFPG